MSRVLLGWMFLIPWGAVTTVGMASLMVGHTVAMPEPSSTQRFAHAARHHLEGEDGVLHVVPAQCSCTRALVDHLVARGAHGPEVVAVVGPLPGGTNALSDAGYGVVEVAPTRVEADLGVVAGPVWLALQEGEVVYAGGYFARPAAQHPLLEDTLEGLAAGQPVSPLPIYGCAADPTLQQQLDPLGLRHLQ